MKSRKQRRTARHTATTMQALILAGSAVLALVILGVWERTGALAAPFWTEGAWVAGAFLAAAPFAWSAFTLVQHRFSAPLRQAVALAAMLAGLLLLGALFWLRGMHALGKDAPAPVAWEMLPAVGGAAAIPFLLAAVAVQAALLPVRGKWDTRRLDLRAVNGILLLSIMALLLLPGGAAAWQQAHPNPADASQSVNPFLSVAVGAAPWAVPVLAIGVALFAGQVALQLLRRPGVAVMLFAAVIFYQAIANFVFVQAAGVVGLDATAHLLALLAAMMMDAAYMFRLDLADDRRTLWYALSASVAFTAGAALILLPGAVGHPSATPAAVVGVVGGGALAGLSSGWCGAEFGGWLHSLPDPKATLSVSI